MYVSGTKVFTATCSYCSKACAIIQLASVKGEALREIPLEDRAEG